MSHNATSGLHQTQGVWDNTLSEPVSSLLATFAGYNNHTNNSNCINSGNNSVGSTNRTSQMRTRHSNRHQPQQTLLNNVQPIICRASDVILRPIAFYDQIHEIIQLTALQNSGIVGRANESVIEFKLTIEQADLLAMNGSTKHIILRFCLLDSSMPQDDTFPPDIIIHVNGAQLILPPAITNPNRPQAPAKRPGQHLEITKECKLCPFVQNMITVKWFIDQTDQLKQYAITVMIGDKLSSDTLLGRIKERGFTDPEATKRLIADSDQEVATTNFQCPLVCPIGKMRITNPCKSSKCHHLPCFDALCYLQMNERKATWNCPVCNQPAYYPDLMIDGYFVDILRNTSLNVTEVTLNLDGSWNPVLKLEQPTSAGNPPPEVITISDDDDD